MAVRNRALMPCAVLLVLSGLLGAAGCTVAEGSGQGVPARTPSIVVPRTQPALRPAVDCAKSTEQLAAESETDGVQLTLSTDPSRTSLLLKNTGSLTVVVIPDAAFTTRLASAPHANPKDAASRAALTAVNNSGGVAAVPGIPPYVPKSQIVTLPPQWAVCALTDDAKETASVRYVQDRASSAQYFVTKGLADQLLLKTGSDRSRPTLIRCARGTLRALKAYPNLPDIELYVAVLGGPRYACRASYQALLGGDARATGQLGAAVINRLGSVPRLLPNSRLLTTAAGP
ncbi:hypothetical protein [Kribbella shirazensis]|uniref:Uncharacterized protein n=1 Tax=Kribbella shirazensis TaxID=1105143 RepID=A0A7X5VCH3_9ACTN|nr:hypothetical protein [Kribbella shirazensis]NIK58617.1 hypothetical protein [Kribbella shirazensis]